MQTFNDNEIRDIFFNIKKYHEKHLKDLGVILPHLIRGGKYSKDILTLVYLAKDYPNTEVVTKKELTEFIQIYYPDTLDVQQARHLGAQKGWFIISGKRGDNSSMSLNPGEYKLVSLEKAYPGFSAERRDKEFDGDEWEALKARYDYRCACCGSKEGEPQRYWKNTKTVLQKGHMNPNKPLTLDNTIPQCDKCNRADKNNWIYDSKGRVISISNETIIDTCSEEIKKAVYDRLKKLYSD